MLSPASYVLSQTGLLSYSTESHNENVFSVCAWVLLNMSAALLSS